MRLIESKERERSIEFKISVDSYFKNKLNLICNICGKFIVIACI